MADTKISALTAAGSFLSTDQFPVNEGGTTKRVTGTQVSAWIKALYAVPVTYSPANPTGTTSLAGFVMMGMGSTCIFTPLFTGRVLVTFTGQGQIATGNGGQVRGAYGTGVAPGNGAAASGTIFGTIKNFAGASTPGYVPFAISVVITGLTLSTIYWFDCSMQALTGGTASIANVDCTIHEI